jgi:hypothetical protein
MFFLRGRDDIENEKTQTHELKINADERVDQSESGV